MSKCIVRPRVQLFCNDPSLTLQYFKPECDITTIMKRFSRTGQLPQFQGGKYGDFSNVPDYQDALNLVIEAQNAFDSLDAKLRKRFNNDPAEMISFVQDDNNREEASRLGMLKVVDNLNGIVKENSAIAEPPLSPT